jgi:hypothetical protein
MGQHQPLHTRGGDAVSDMWRCELDQVRSLIMIDSPFDIMLLEKSFHPIPFM